MSQNLNPQITVFHALKWVVLVYLVAAALFLTVGCGTIERIRAAFKDKQEATEELPWGTWDRLNYLGMEPIDDAPVVIKIMNVRIGARTTWDQDVDPDWPQHTGIHNDPNAVLNLAFEHDGQWYMTPTEWLLEGMHHQENKIYRSDRGNKKLWADPFKDHEIEPGTRCALVITHGWGSARGRGRSNASGFTR